MSTQDASMSTNDVCELASDVSLAAAGSGGSGIGRGPTDALDVLCR
jgi:hypothetical protein